MRARPSWLKVLGDAIRFLGLCFRSRTSLAAENLFLRKQLAFYQERKIKPRRADNPTRLPPVLLSRWFDWRSALAMVKPKTLIASHPKGFRLFWRWKSESGRRPIPPELQRLIRRRGRRDVAEFERDGPGRADPNAACHCNPDRHGNAHGNGDADRNRNGDHYRNCDSYVDRNINADSDRHGYGHSDGDRHRDADCHCYSDCDRYGHGHTHAYPYRNSYADRNADSHCYRDRHGHRNSHSDSYPNRDADPYRHGDGHSNGDRHCHSDGDSDSDRYGNANADREADADRDADAHRHGEGHTDADSDDHCQRDSVADPDPGLPSPLRRGRLAVLWLVWERGPMPPLRRTA